MRSLRIDSIFTKFKYLAPILGFVALIGGLVIPQLSSSEPFDRSVAPRPSSEKEREQSECSYIVRSIVTDLAEQIYFAAEHRLPDTNVFSVSVKEGRGSSTEAPVFELQIRLSEKVNEIKCDLPIRQMLWSPEVYRGVATNLATAVRLGPGHTDKTNTFFLDRMRSMKADDVVRADKSVSGKLEKDFLNAELHEEAAVALGVFAFRDHSGKFSDLRAPLSRLTTHLTMARLLRGSEAFDVNGQIAEAIMLTLAGNEVEAMKRLDQIEKSYPNELPMVRALRARSTGDYRPMDGLTATNLSPIEYAELFFARAKSVDPTLAWHKYWSGDRTLVVLTRIANQGGNSVDIGHVLDGLSVPLEGSEIQLAHNVMFLKMIPPGRFLAEINELPKNCLVTRDDKVHVEVIGWGQWAYSGQRHLCHAIEQNFNFLQFAWGVPDKAAAFAARCETIYGGLRLYPFVRRFTAMRESEYRKAVDDALHLASDSPEFVPANCWNYLFYKPEKWPAYSSMIDSHIRDWFRYDPLPGTAYDLGARLIHPALVTRPGAAERLERLHETAPYNEMLGRYLLQRKYGEKPNHDQVAGVFKAILPYNVNAMIAEASTVRDDPAQFRELMLKAAELNLDCYYILADFEIEQGREDAAANLFDRACASDRDSVQVASRSLWRVKYFLKKGQKENARQIADQGGRVYSEIGLEAKAFYLEQTGDDDGAFEWYYKIAERYGDSEPLDDFRKRYRRRTGDSRFDSVEKARAKSLFPNGQEKVTIKDFSGPPSDGTLMAGQSELLRAAGLQDGAVIVALNGIRTHNQTQYAFVRDVLLTGPEMELIVWQNDRYQEIKASPPDHKFGVSIRDYAK